MSLQNAKQLIEKLTANEALKTQFRDAAEAGFESLAKEQGCNCTLAEFQQALREIAASKGVKEDDQAHSQAAVVVSVVVV